MARDTARSKQRLCSALRRWHHECRAALDCESHQRRCEINNTCKCMQIPLLLNIEVLNMLIRCILISVNRHIVGSVATRSVLLLWGGLWGWLCPCRQRAVQEGWNAQHRVTTGRIKAEPVLV